MVRGCCAGTGWQRPPPVPAGSRERARAWRGAARRCRLLTGCHRGAPAGRWELVVLPGPGAASLPTVSCPLPAPREVRARCGRRRRVCPGAAIRGPWVGCTVRAAPEEEEERRRRRKRRQRQGRERGTRSRHSPRASGRKNITTNLRESTECLRHCSILSGESVIKELKRWRDQCRETVLWAYRELSDCSRDGLVMISATPLYNGVHSWTAADRIRMCGIYEDSLERRIRLHFSPLEVDLHTFNITPGGLKDYAALFPKLHAVLHHAIWVYLEMNISGLERRIRLHFSPLEVDLHTFNITPGGLKDYAALAYF
ncbi:hypothetical protein NDU88_002729 [Pleurodeles waltl]|uniref:Uncharacterized protein n=1 Tax=Pleurodeles waltl TaxID=8319 RepID=A0AAV7VDB4_PLEWA|nr:hypothetical protein NDU88_002729 [Pleurodeles waltl]